MTATLGPRERRRLAFALFLFTWFAFVATASGRIKASDIQTEFKVAASLIYHGTMESDRTPDTAVGVEGRDYSNHLVGESVLLLPAALVDGGELTARAVFVIAMINPLFGAATLGLLLLLLVDLGFNVRVAVATSLVLGFATVWWPYAHDAFDVTPNAFFLLLALLAARRRAHGGRASWLWLSGMALALALLLRYSAGVAILPLLAYLGWRRRAHGGLAIAAELARWTLPVAAAAGVIGALNLLRFGSPVDIGWAHAPESYIQPAANQLLALLGLLISPGKGLILYAPVLLLAIRGAPRLARRDAPLTWTIVAIAGLTFLFYARLTNWSGDQAWGPRYLVPVVPMLAILAAPGLERWGAMGRAGRGAIAGLVALGAAVNLSAVLTGYERVMAVMRPLPPSDRISDPGFYFVLANSRLLEQLRSIRTMVAGPNPFGQYGLVDGSQDPGYLYTPDFWWADPWSTAALRPFLVAVVLLLTVLVSLAGYRLLRAVRELAPRAAGGTIAGDRVIKSEQVSQIL